jgi:hypothetical protein
MNAGQIYPVLLVAGNYQQAKEYAMDNHLVNWRYIGSPKDALGRTVIDFRYVGTYYNRTDLREVAAILERRAKIDRG